jgi:predicted SAM-dependent methyltransferase
MSIRDHATPRVYRVDSDPRRVRVPGEATRSRPIRLHIGGWEPRKGWTIMDVRPGPDVDMVGSARDLRHLADSSVIEIYASHVYEHLGYVREFPEALREAHRVLKPGGLFRAGVPDMDVLCRLFLDPALGTDGRAHVMRMMFGGQVDEHDFHRIGLNFELFRAALEGVGFRNVRRVEDFGLFRDTSTLVFAGVRISLNVVAIK